MPVGSHSKRPRNAIVQASICHLPVGFANVRQGNAMIERPVQILKCSCRLPAIVASLANGDLEMPNWTTRHGGKGDYQEDKHGWRCEGNAGRHYGRKIKNFLGVGRGSSRCPNCGGSGRWQRILCDGRQIDEKCATCRGSGLQKNGTDYRGHYH
eukprot:359401-Chlamydomonas_euryale.AAC.1